MKIGIQTVITRGHVPPLEQGRAVAERGFAAFWAGEHHHFPDSTPVPDFYKETGVPDFYKFSPDPLITLGAIQAANPQLEVGTAILLLPIHDTLIIANQIATLDNLTGGKTMFGIGVGWNKPELAHHGVEFESRVEKSGEQIRALKQLWANDKTEFHGKFVNFETSWQGPKPVQKPHPPLLLGGRPLKRNFELLVEVYDGWMPTDTYAKTYGVDLDASLERLRGMFTDAGRDPDSMRNVMEYAELMLYDRDPAKYAEDAPTRAELEHLEELGFEQVIIGVPTFSESHFHGALDYVAKLTEPWL